MIQLEDWGWPQGRFHALLGISIWKTTSFTCLFKMNLSLNELMIIVALLNFLSTKSPSLISSWHFEITGNSEKFALRQALTCFGMLVR